MNARILIIVLIMVAMPGFFLQASASQTEPEMAGYVFEIKGTCYIRDDERSQQHKLTAKNGNGTKMRTGQELICDAGGSLKFKFTRSGADVEVTPQTPPIWYTIPNVPARPLSSGTDSSGGSRTGGRIAEYRNIPSMREASASTPPAAYAVGNSSAAAAASAGGGTSGGAASIGDLNPSVSATTNPSAPRVSLSIISPAWNSVIFPDALVFRWKLISGGDVPVELSIRSVNNKELIWKQDGVAVKSGELVSEEARAVLKHFREKNHDLKLEFFISSQGTTLDYNYFKLISAEEEKEFKEEMSELDKQEGFLRLIGRADVFARHGFYAESAQEYEQALDASPESEDLQIAVVFAQCRAGNRLRAGDIRNKFKIPPPAWDNACQRGLNDR